MEVTGTRKKHTLALHCKLTVHYENGLIKAIMSATMNQVALITQDPRNNVSIVNYDIMILGLALKDRVLV